MSASSDSLSWIAEPIKPMSVFRTRLRSSHVTFARFSHRDDREKVLRGSSEDSHIAIVVIGKEPEHEFYWDRKLRRTEGAPVKFADLRAEAYCRIRGPIDNFHLHMPRTALDELTHDAGARPIERLNMMGADAGEDPILASIKLALIAASDRADEISQLAADHLVLALYTHLTRAYGGMRDLPVKTGGLAGWQVRRAKELIEANIDKPVSMADVSDECGLSAAHFSRAFKVSTGMTPYEWLQTCRVDAAMEMMRTSDMPLAGVAVACGFTDQSHFTRIFSRLAGQTPAAWRRNGSKVL